MNGRSAGWCEWAESRKKNDEIYLTTFISTSRLSYCFLHSFRPSVSPPTHTHVRSRTHAKLEIYSCFSFLWFFFLWLHTILCAILSSSYAIGLIANRWKGPKNPEIVRHNKKQKDNEIVFRHLYESLKISLCKYEWLLFVRIFSVAFYVAAAAVHSTHTKVHSLDSIRIAEDIAVATSQWVKPNERRLRVKIYTLSFFCSNPWSKHIRYFKWLYIRCSSMNHPSAKSRILSV